MKSQVIKVYEKRKEEILMEFPTYISLREYMNENYELPPIIEKYANDSTFDEITLWLYGIGIGVDSEVREAFERIENTLDCGLKDSVEMFDGTIAKLDKDFLRRDLDIIRKELGLKPRWEI